MLLLINIINKIKEFIYILENIIRFIKWGLGIGDWGLGIGDWAQSPIPNPQSPKNINKSIIYFIYILKII